MTANGVTGKVVGRSNVTTQSFNRDGKTMVKVAITVDDHPQIDRTFEFPVEVFTGKIDAQLRGRCGDDSATARAPVPWSVVQVSVERPRRRAATQTGADHAPLRGRSCPGPPPASSDARIDDRGLHIGSKFRG